MVGWRDGWVACAVWVGLKKLITVLDRFDTYKGGVSEEGSLQGRLESEPVSSTDRDRGTRVRG